MFSNSQAPSRIRAQTPTRPSRLTASSPTPSRPSSSLSRPSSIRPASSMSQRTPIRAGQSATAASSQGTRSSHAFTTPSRPASSMSHFRPTTPAFVPRAGTTDQAYCGTVKVSVRPRPLAPHLQPHGWELDAHGNTVTTTDLGEFQYDHVYDPAATNHDVYHETVKPVVDKCLEGFNGTIFAYGMTGSGKTYSMQGSDYEAGIIQLAVDAIYAQIRSDHARQDHAVSLSYLEIYNEKLYDLLNPDTSIALKTSASSSAFSSTIASAGALKDDIKIRSDPVQGVSVVGLHEVHVRSPDELLSHIAKGDSIRRTGGTDFNARSSRSHAIVMIRLKSHDLASGAEKCATLSLCDLAGSEKATTQQERRKEGAYINKSLLALSTVISKLSAQSLSSGNGGAGGGAASAQTQRTHIPYRDSKLTRLLQGSLSGSSVISILCTIHLSANAGPETANTLRFAARAKNVQLTVKKNETMGSAVDKDRVIARLRAELDQYKQQAQQAQAAAHQHQHQHQPATAMLTKSRKTSQDSSTSSVSSGLREEYNQLEAENKILMEQVEHFKRLNDYSRLNATMVKNEHLQALSELGVDRGHPDVRAVVVGLEDFCKRQVLEIEEMASYISHLENRLKRAEVNSGGSHDLGAMSSLVKDQEEELLELREQLTSKDSIIKALKNSNRIRESLDAGGAGAGAGAGGAAVRAAVRAAPSDDSMRSSAEIYSDMNLSADMDSSVVMAADDTFPGVAFPTAALKPVHADKLNQLNSSPPAKHLDVGEAW